MNIKISILVIAFSIISITIGSSSNMTIPLAFSQFVEDDEKDKSFLLRARIIINDQSTEQVEIKLKSENVAQQEFFDKNIENKSKTKLKFKFNEAFNAPYEICSESIQDNDVYACKGGILYTLRPNVTLTL